MKRNRSLTDILSNLTLNEENKKPKYSIIKSTHIEHDDIFNIGKISLGKDFYSKQEVIMILNSREASLYAKFIKLIKDMIYYHSGDSLNIPKWVK